MPDQRRSGRKRSFRAAYIGLDDTPASLFCLIRDLSPTGAKLEVIGDLELPDAFDLHINGRDGTYRAEIVWRGPGEVGVKFAVKGSVADRAVRRVLSGANSELSRNERPTRSSGLR